MNNPEFVYLDSDKTQLLENVISVSAGDKHSVALVIEKNDASDNKGVVYTWGSNEFGQIGRTDVGGKVSLPVKTVYTDDADDFSIIAIDAGYGATSTLQSTGYMWTYGLNNNGQLGNLDVDNTSVPVLVGKGEINVTPSELTIRKGDTVEINPLLTISATDAFNLLGLTGTGSTNVTYTSLNKDILTVSESAPQTMTGVKAGKANLKVTSGGVSAYVVVTVSGGSEDDKYTPMVAAGEGFTVVLKANGSVWTWGDNSSDQLGRSTADTIGMVSIAEDVMYIAAGKNSAYAVTYKKNADGSEESKLYAWGDNTFGQLGGGTTAAKSVTPVAVTGPNGKVMTNVKSVSVTDNSVLVLTNDGFVYGFGEMFVYNSRKIAQIPNLTGVAQISGMYALSLIHISEPTRH